MPCWIGAITLAMTAWELAAPPGWGLVHDRGPDRLGVGEQRVAEQVATATAGLGEQQLLVDRLAQPLLAQRHTAATQHPHALLAGGGSQLLGSRVLPTPASPPITTSSGWPVAARASSWRSRASSLVRPTNRPVLTWEAMSALVCRRAGSEQGRARI
jgi:hypothetical protein